MAEKTYLHPNLRPPLMRTPEAILLERLEQERNHRRRDVLSSIVRKVKSLQQLRADHYKQTQQYFRGLVEVNKAQLARQLRRLFPLEACEQEWRDEDIRLFKSQDARFARIARLEKELAEELNRYIFVPRIRVEGFITRVSWLSSARHERPESDALARLLWVIQEGKLEYIDQCQFCGRWYYSRGPARQKFCTKECRLNSPEWKTHRARYMREYRMKDGIGGKTHGDLRKG